jgi:hypothetical protein
VNINIGSLQPVADNLWYDPTNKMLVFYDDINWQPITKISGVSLDTQINTLNSAFLSNNPNQAVKRSFYVGSSVPPDAVAGTVWFDTSNNKIKYYDGSDWQNVVIDNANAIYVSSSGNVGIGNPLPSTKLSVNGRISTLYNNYFDTLGSIYGGFDEYGETPLLYGAYNKLAFLTKEGGTVDFSIAPTGGTADNLFDGKGAWVYWKNPSGDISLTIDLPSTLNYMRELIIQFVGVYYPTSFTIEFYNASNSTWTTFDNVVGWNKNYYAKKLNSYGYNIDKIRFTMHSYNNSDNVHISEIIMTFYNVPPMNYYLYRGGGQNVYGGVNFATVSGSVGIATTNPNSTLHCNGSFALPIITKTANYTVSATDCVILGDASSGAITFTLPTASGIAGRLYEFVKIDNSSNAITVKCNGSETINGSSSTNLSSQWQRLGIISNGSNWIVLNN